MKRFVLRCERGDFHTRTVLHIEDLREESDRVRTASTELVLHAATTHGLPSGAWSFSAVEVKEAAGDLWAIDVVGESS